MIRDGAQAFCHAECNESDRLPSVEMFVIKGVGTGFVPRPIKMSIARGVNGTRVAGENFLLMNTDVMLEIRHYQFTQTFIDGLTESQVDVVGFCQRAPASLNLI